MTSQYRSGRLTRRVSGLLVLTALVAAVLAAPARAAAPSCHLAVSNPVPKAPGSVTVTVHTSPRARAAFTSTPASQPATVTVTADGSGAAAVRYTLQSQHSGRYSVRVAVTSTGGQRASCSSVFTVNGKRPTNKPALAPAPPRPRGATAATRTATAANAAEAGGINYSMNCNYLYQQVNSTIVNMTPYLVAYREWAYDWYNGVWINRSADWTYVGGHGFSDRPFNVGFATYISMWAEVFYWDGATWVGPLTNYAMSQGDGAGGDGNGVYWCFA